jgi:plasmid stabilization system protein ParE
MRPDDVVEIAGDDLGVAGRTGHIAVGPNQPETARADRRTYIGVEQSCKSREQTGCRGRPLREQREERRAARSDELEAKCHAVAASLDLYPARTDLAPGLRMAAHGRRLLLYRDLPGQDTVRVERILHSARSLPRLL